MSAKEVSQALFVSVLLCHTARTFKFEYDYFPLQLPRCEALRNAL